MRIAFRTDASSQIGTGHFMRCLTLADTLKQCGAQIRFVSRHMPRYLREMLDARAYEYVPLDTDPGDQTVDELFHARWLGASQAADAQDTASALGDLSWDWLVVDHYALDARWESALRKMAARILVIDDLADRQHDCDVLLDQNFYADMASRYTGKVPQDCRLLTGPRYALLRHEFRVLREQSRPRTGAVQRILIFFGGMDADNFTSQAIKAVASIRSSGLMVDVVIGAQHGQRSQIEAACAEFGFACHVQTSRMADLMLSADLAIGAGGSAVWERCCLGLPTLTFCTADNQIRQLADAASEGMLYSPEVKPEVSLVMKRHLDALIENSALRHHMSRAAMAAVDGRGALRVVQNLDCSDIEMQLANASDSANLFEWRNHASIRAVSRNTELIAWEDHQTWFDSVLTAAERRLLIGRRAGVPVGVVRFDIQGDAAEVSIYLVPDQARFGEVSGQGRELLLAAERWCANNLPAVRRIRAQVLGGNERSQGLFLGAGYQVDTTHYSKRLH